MINIGFINQVWYCDRFCDIILVVGPHVVYSHPHPGTFRCLQPVACFESDDITLTSCRSFLTNSGSPSEPQRPAVTVPLLERPYPSMHSVWFISG